ncbi:hypothetical protein [Kitasatospora sp. MBT63]|uniref:hypothetical protein n=1 Tax=Kitasatospora sp. MBT63 TaxID=1444768 RepID=UPI000565E0A8|nr:hypothetical protein [Kitasatospora sp. MBT63]
MGTNSKTSHQAYTVAPAEPGEAPEEPTGAQQSETPELQAAQQVYAAAAELAQLIGNGGGFDENGDDGVPLIDVPDDPVEQFEQFAEQIKAQREALALMKEAGAPQEVIDETLKAIKAQSLEYLSKLTPEELQAIAAAQGFEHPALVGMSGKSQHPLVHWLDPAYDQDIISKAKIQAAATKRYAQLVAGETVGGLTLADLHALEGTPAPAAPGPPGPWTASPAEVNAAVNSWSAAAKAYAAAKGGPGQAQALAELVAAENKVATAESPEMGATLAQLQATAKLTTDQALSGGGLDTYMVAPAVKAAVESGQLTKDEANHLKAAELLALVRSSTPEAERALLSERAQERKGQLAALDQALDGHTWAKPDQSSHLALPALAHDGLAAQDKVASWVANAGELHGLQQSAQGWIHEVIPHPNDLSMTNPGLLASHQVDPKELKKELSAWAKQQPLGQLRQVADKLGMPASLMASRATVQAYLAAHMDPSLDKAAVLETAQAAHQAKKEAKLAAVLASPAVPPAPPPPPAPAVAGPQPKPATAGEPAPGAAPAAAAAVPATPKASKVPKVQPPAGSFAAKHQALVAALQQAQATKSDVPARVDAAQIQATDFGPGKTAHIGGTHPKTLHTAPDGSQWMFKHYTSASAARASAEAAASHISHLGGVATVPVYEKEIGGKKGCIQPMVSGASQLSASPKSWSQTEVDSVVRNHVVAWAVGDHDGHAANMLRTASGGMSPIDRGQAFKYFGTDELKVGWTPDGLPAGSQYMPVHQKAYLASQSGGLAPGVKINPAVAHPVIKQIESIPDAQWRAVLHTTAHEGAAAKVRWEPHMRKRAAKALGVKPAEVTTAQVAEAFLDYSCERKNGLRTAFADFYTEQMKLPSGAALKYGN